MEIDAIFVGIHLRVTRILGAALSTRYAKLSVHFTFAVSIGLLAALIGLHHAHIRPSQPNDNQCFKQANHLIQHADIVQIAIEPPHHDYALSSLSNVNAWWNDETTHNESLQNAVVFELAYSQGYFLLPNTSLVNHNVRIVQLYVSAASSCFGHWTLAAATWHLFGYDSIAINHLSREITHPAFLKNVRTGHTFALGRSTKQSTESHVASPSWTSWLAYSTWLLCLKGELLLTTLFLFFATTTLVSSTLCQTQIRMLNFTEQLRQSGRAGLPVFGMVLEHTMQSLSFVPVLVGILFFLFEFFHDHVLAFMLLMIVWMCESFTVLFARTSVTMSYFPKLFALYFLIFGLYFFSFPFGFHYIALGLTTSQLLHAIQYYMYFFEVPAALSGRISIHRPRMLVLVRQQRRTVLQQLGLATSQQHSTQSTSQLHGMSAIHPPVDMHGVGLRHRRSFAYQESPSSRVRSLEQQHANDMDTEDSDDYARPMQFTRRTLRRSTQNISVPSPRSASANVAESIPNNLSINPLSPSAQNLLSPTSSTDGSTFSRAARLESIPRMITTLLRHSQSIKDSIQTNSTTHDENITLLRPARARSASAASSSHESKESFDTLTSPTLAHLKSNALDEVLMSLRAALHALDPRGQPDSSPTSATHSRRPSTRRLSNALAPPPRRLDF